MNRFRALARASWRRVVVLGAALLFVVAAAGAQEWGGPGRLQGLVLDASGKPLDGATVTLIWPEAAESSPSKGPKPAVTSKKGRWSFLGLIDGLWRIEIEAEGYIPFQEQVTVYARGGDTLRLQLKPIPEAVKEQERLSGVNELLGQGNTLAQQGKFADARAAYEGALTGATGEYRAGILAGIASTYVQEGNFDSALERLNEALAIDANNEESLRMMVAILASQGRDDEAEEYLARLPDEASLDSATQLNLGIMRYNDGDLEEATRIFDAVIAKNPTRADAYYYSGLVAVNSGQNERARERFRKYLELEPGGDKSSEVKEFLKYLEQ